LTDLRQPSAVCVRFFSPFIGFVVDEDFVITFEDFIFDKPPDKDLISNDYFNQDR